MMGILDAIRQRWTADLDDEMDDDDLDRWATCARHVEVGRLIALHLEGELRSRPGFSGPLIADDIAGDDERTIVARLNRHGYVIHSAQLGAAGTRRQPERRAAVAGFMSECDYMTILGRYGETNGTVRIARCAPPGKAGAAFIAPVARVGRAYRTDYGIAMPEGAVRDPDDGYGCLPPRAVNSLVIAPQVVIYDNTWGPSDDLWFFLAEIAALLENERADLHPLLHAWRWPSGPFTCPDCRRVVPVGTERVAVLDDGDRVCQQCITPER